MKQLHISLMQSIIAIVSFIVAVGFSIAGFVTPPEGQLHDSNLYLVAQFLLVTTSIFGVSAVISGKGWRIETHETISNSHKGEGK